MSNTREIEIQWQPIDLTVKVLLDEPRNQELADAIWDALPYHSLQGHALVAGAHLYHVAPAHELLHLHARYTIDRRTVPPGTVFASRLQHLGIKYGTLTEPMNAAPIGHVHPLHLDRLAKAGAAVWDAVYRNRTPITASVRRVGSEPGHVIRKLPARLPRAAAVIDQIHTETERAWLAPPEELRELHEGRIHSGAGTDGTVLTTLLFVNGETRPLGYASYGGLVRAALTTDLPLPALRQMAQMLIGVPAEFLGYCGLARLWDLTREVLGVLDEVTERSDFVALMAHMALYVNCLGGWNLQLFPWALGDTLRAQQAA